MLKPCPFCGGAPFSVRCAHDDDGYWAVECRQCNGCSPGRFCGVHGEDQAEAERLWNERATLPEARLVEPDCALADQIEREVKEVLALKEDRGDAEYWLLNTFVANSERICAALRAWRSPQLMPETVCAEHGRLPSKDGKCPRC